MAGAPGIEPGNAGIKIQCLTAWRRPIKIDEFSNKVRLYRQAKNSPAAGNLAEELNSD